jgi:hypothetical protein
MSGAPPNGNSGHTTIVQAGIKLGSQVVQGLRPEFLALLLVNVLLMGAFIWFVDARAKHFALVFNQLLTSCLQTRG